MFGAAAFMYITFRQQKKTLKDTTKGYRPLFEDGPNPMWIYDTSTLRILDVNKAATVKYGYTREEFLHLQLADLRPDTQITQLYNYLASASPDQTEYRVRAVKHKKKDGTLFYVHIQSSPTTFRGHQAHLIQALDIHEKVLAEQKRKEASRKLANFRRLVSKSSIMCTVDDTGKILSANKNLCDLSKYSEEELVGKPVLKLFLNHQPTLDFKRAQTYLKAGKDCRGELQCRAGDGSTYWVAASIIPVLNEHGMISHYLAIGYDITEKKQSEEKMKEAFLRYDTLAKVTYDTVWEMDLQNKSLTRTDISPEDDGHIQKRSRSSSDWWTQRVHPEDYNRVVNGLQQVMEKGKKQWEAEYRYLDDNKEYRYVIDRGLVIYNENMNPVRVIGAMQDIHSLKESQKEIKKLSLVAEKTQNAVIITDKNGLIEWVNDSFTHLSDYTAAEVIGKKPGSFLQGPLTNPNTVDTIRTKLREKKEFTIELINYRKNGSPYWNRIAISPIFDENGELTHYISVETDVTERKRFIERLEKQNKQLKKIAWISSHDVRRPVASMLGLISLYDYNCPEAPFNKEILHHLNTVTMELDAVIHRIVDKTVELEEK